MKQAACDYCKIPLEKGDMIDSQLGMDGFVSPTHHVEAINITFVTSKENPINLCRSCLKETLDNILGEWI
jgi:hypothetical protein